MRRMLAVAGVVLALLACGDSGGQQAPTGSPLPSPEPSTTAPATITVDAYFVNAEMGDVCEEVFAVPRVVSATAPLREAIEALLAGPTDAERAAGYAGWFSQATRGLLDRVRLEGTRAYVSFGEALPSIIPNASSSCGSIGLLMQLDRTVTQFGDVDEAWYSLEGDRAAFYGWLQMAAPDDPGVLPSPTGPATPSPSGSPTAARAIPSDLVGTEWTSLPTVDPVVALTFDAGANGDAVASILATLDATATPATFFLTGRWVTAYPSHAVAIGARHPVGNHTVTHPDLTTLDDAAVRSEIEAAGETVAAATGRDPRPWFRFPYGAREPRLIALVNEQGYGSVRWSVDTLGWKGTSGGSTAASVAQRVMDDLHPGSIVLMHVGSHPTDGSTLDAEALPDVITRVRQAGYRFVDLDAVLAPS